MDRETDYSELNAWMRVLAGIAAFTAILMALGWGLGWFGAALDQTGPERIRSLSAQTNDRFQALEAQRQDIARAELALVSFRNQYGTDASVWPQGKNAEYSQLLTRYQNATAAYDAACGQYRAYFSDTWRDIPAPNDLPKTCDMWPLRLDF